MRETLKETRKTLERDSGTRGRDSKEKDSRGDSVRTLCSFSSRVDRKKPPPPAGFPIYYIPSSRTVSKMTPLEEFVPGSSRGVLLLTVFDEGT